MLGILARGNVQKGLIFGGSVWGKNVSDHLILGAGIFVTRV